MDNNRFSSFFGGNADKWIGGFIGLILALVVLEFGILRTIYILACVGVGVYFGSKKENRERFSRLVQELFSHNK